MHRFLPFILAALTAYGCVSEAPTTTGPLTEGAYVLRGEAEVDTMRGVTTTWSEHMSLFVDADGIPTHVRDERWEQGTVLTFAPGEELSQVLSTGSSIRAGCTFQVERSTGCAVWTYENCWGAGPNQDGADDLTGVLRACPTDEVFTHELSVHGALESTTVLPNGLYVIEANYPLDATRDSVQVTVDGVDASPAIGTGVFTQTASLGDLGVGAVLDFAFTGDRAVSITFPTAFSTTGSLSDLSFDTAPAAGTVDARGLTPTFDAGALVLSTTATLPGENPFAIAIALGDPGNATQLELDVTVPEVREGGGTRARLVRADGSSSIAERADAGMSAAVPDGMGDVWLVITNADDWPIPGSAGREYTFRLEGLAWR